MRKTPKHRRSSAVDLDHTLDRLATNGAKVNLLSASHARADMTTVAEDGVLFLGVTDLTQIHFVVSHLPVADAFAVPLAVFISTDVFVAGLLLNVCTLSMTDIIDPVAIIGVTSWVFHLAPPVALSKDEIALVDSTCTRQMLASTVVVPL